MSRIENASKAFRFERILKEQRFVSDKWVKDSQKENSHPDVLKEASVDVLRFGKNATNEKELEGYSKGFVLKNTEIYTSWAQPNLEAWCVWRKRRIPNNLCLWI